jgi:hypothetical protein
VLPLGSGRLRLVRLLLLSEPRVEQLHLVRGGRGIRHAEIAHSLLDALLIIESLTSSSSLVFCGSSREISSNSRTRSVKASSSRFS